MMLQPSAAYSKMLRTASRISNVVSTEWLGNKLARKETGLMVVDGSWHMPHTKRDARTEYLQKHLPNAVFFGIDECCDAKSNMGHMLPGSDQFAAYVSNLGIDNDTHVIVYDNNDSFGLFSAQRVWWTFRVFGHNLVSVLDGGLNKWINDGYQTTSELPKIKPMSFRATYQSELVKNYDDIQNNLKRKDFKVLDARSAGRFSAAAPEPREGIPSGHIPESLSIPFTEMLHPQTRTFKSNEELAKVFLSRGVNLNQDLVASCGTGISACMIILAAHQLGKVDMAVYDGSWTEFAQRCSANQIMEGES